MGQCAHAALDLLHRSGPRHPRKQRHRAPRQPGVPWLRAAVPANAATLFKLVQAEGVEATKIEITGPDPTWTAGRSGLGGDYSRLTSFDPLASGIMAGGSGPSRR
jgi:hypothetical protein